MQQIQGHLGKGDQTQPDPMKEDENKAWKSLVEKAITSGDYPTAVNLMNRADESGAGIPTTPYRAYVAAQAPKNLAISEIMNPTQPVVTPPKLGDGNVAVNTPPGFEQGQANAQQQRATINKEKDTLSEIFTPEFVNRVKVKQETGIDIGTKQSDIQWFADYAQIKKANPNVPATDIKTTLASKWGYIPEQATQLKDLPIEERQIMSEQKIWKLMTDPDIDAKVKQSFPDSPADKVKISFILQRLLSQGDPIPEKFTPFLERASELSDDFIRFKAEEEAAMTGAKIGAEYANRDLSATTKATEAKKTKKAQLAGEFEMEPLKPISAENRAKYGVGEKIPTYQSLADSGFRFPTEADRKTYQTLSAVKEQIASMKDLLFSENGVFTNIGDDWVSRKGAQAGLIKDRAEGTMRGQNYEIYSDVLASMARRLLALAGESGGRFTDKDVEQIVKSAPDLGGLIAPIDSSAIAERKFERFTENLNRMLSDITGNTVIKPMGGRGEKPQETPKVETPKPEIQKAPQTAIDYLKENPLLKDAFKKKYGYLPEGF
jgi:hypothetical protein